MRIVLSSDVNLRRNLLRPTSAKNNGTRTEADEAEHGDDAAGFGDGRRPADDIYLTKAGVPVFLSLADIAET
ncbi:MAG: hypothetical protein WEB58_23735 [Planctomycetaceae bacterium]